MRRRDVVPRNVSRSASVMVIGSSSGRLASRTTMAVISFVIDAIGRTRAASFAYSTDPSSSSKTTTEAERTSGRPAKVQYEPALACISRFARLDDGTAAARGEHG